MKESHKYGCTPKKAVKLWQKEVRDAKKRIRASKGGAKWLRENA